MRKLLVPLMVLFGVSFVGVSLAQAQEDSTTTTKTTKTKKTKKTKKSKKAADDTGSKPSDAPGHPRNFGHFRIWEAPGVATLGPLFLRPSLHKSLQPTPMPNRLAKESSPYPPAAQRQPGGLVSLEA